jgi:serine/threonine-protein kinase RsbW
MTTALPDVLAPQARPFPTEYHGWYRDRINSVAEMADVIDRLTAVMADQTYPEDDVFAVRLAVEEAVVNAIRHGHDGDVSRDVQVRYHVDPQRAVIEVEDQGMGFDPHAVADPLAPENVGEPGGRGLFLMRSLMTWILHNERGNRVTLCKYRSA